MSAALPAITEVQRRLAERASALATLRATYRLDAGGDSWTIRIEAGTVEVEAGPTAAADAVLEASAQDWASMLGGQTDPAAAFMQGRLTVHGDMDLAMRLLEVLA